MEPLVRQLTSSARVTTPLASRTFEPLLPAGLGFAAGAMTGWSSLSYFPRRWLPASAASQPLPLLASTALMIAIEPAIGL